MRQRHHDILLLDQVFDRQVGMVLDDLGAALVRVLGTDVLQLGANDREQPLGRARMSPRSRICTSSSWNSVTILSCSNAVRRFRRRSRIALGLRVRQPIAFWLEAELVGKTVGPRHHLAAAREHFGYGA